MRKHLEITLTTRAISPPNRERPSSSPRRHTLHPDVEERYARLHPFTAATLAARTTAAPEPPPPPVDAAAAAKETQPLPRVHGKRQPSPPPLARPWSAQHRADGAYHFDWRVLYDEAAAAAESLVSENTEARAACVQQAQLIDGQRTRLQQLAVERRRLGAGEVAPSWVVSGIESHLASVEAERNLLRAEAVKAELKLKEEAIEQARLGAQRDELERQQKEMVRANAALRHVTRLCTPLPSNLVPYDLQYLLRTATGPAYLAAPAASKLHARTPKRHTDGRYGIQNIDPVSFPTR